MAHEYGWPLDDFDRLARGTAVGHLLECAGQLCGGYYAEPGLKEVPDMAHLGFPFADVDRNGNATLGKVEGTGGCITLATAKEQLLYEVDRSVWLRYAGRDRRLLHRDAASRRGRTASTSVAPPARHAR